MLNKKLIKIIIVISILILSLILYKFYINLSKSIGVEIQDISNSSVELSEQEVLNIKNWLLENTKSTSENLDLNDF